MHRFSTSYKLRDIIQVVDKSPTPSLLPVFRSQQQAELLALILGDPTAEHSMTELAERTGVPYASVHREVERADAAGLVSSRLVGRTRLIRADVSSPYFAGLSDVLVKAFGVPWVIGQELARVEGIDAAYVYGSWAARFSGEDGDRPIGDIDLLVLGGPDRDDVYAAASEAEHRLGRAVQVTIRSADWLTDGSGTFHDTVAGRPMVPVPVATGTAREDQSPATARPPRRPPRSRQGPSRVVAADLRARRIEVLSGVARPAKAFECLLREAGDRLRELPADGVLDGHVRALATGGVQPLSDEQCLGGHAVSVVGSGERALDVTGSEATISSQKAPDGSSDDCRR